MWPKETGTSISWNSWLRWIDTTEVLILLALLYKKAVYFYFCNLIDYRDEVAKYFTAICMNYLTSHVAETFCILLVLKFRFIGLSWLHSHSLLVVSLRPVDTSAEYYIAYSLFNLIIWHYRMSLVKRYYFLSNANRWKNKAYSIFRLLTFF